MPKSNDYMDFPQPSLALVQTVDGFFRVEVHGPDSLRDNQAYSVMDIGRGPTREAAMEQAQKWFSSMADRTPKQSEITDEQGRPMTYWGGKAKQSTDAEYPECSGDPNNCPENEGHGCCGIRSGGGE